MKVNLGSLLLLQMKAVEAEPLLMEAYVQFSKQNGADHPGTIKLERKLARCYDLLGRPEDARAMRAKHNLLPDTQPTTGATNRN